ncbi:uncharacterized protein LOC126762616 [Bactrocera neohumeralis]|uniref:uncharacterized protein LOC126762616 n=1 Tax=Bactrocera neohumeralis TaxID=98809 RepID=UPI00216607CE|nr:uncharacterized protein LOC126762616 [Bactrocera neohumeralis]
MLSIRFKRKAVKTLFDYCTCHIIMSKSSTSCLLLQILIMCCLYGGNTAADDNNAFTLVFGSESTLQSVEREVSDAKGTLTDVVNSSSQILEDYDALVEDIEKLETALGKQNDIVSKKLGTFIEENIAIQSTELLQELTADQKWLQEMISAQQRSLIAELQTSEGKLLAEIKQNTTPNEVWTH